MVNGLKIYIDENLPSQLADALNLLQQPLNFNEKYPIQVLSIKKVFGEGAKDEDWIPKVGAEKAYVITQDSRIQSQKHQRELYLKCGVGIFFLNPPSKGGFKYWDMVQKLIAEWDNIKRIIRKEKPPFAYRASSKKHFEKMD
ncbi:hypothetical protein E0W68_01500 [Flavobacterium salilacus subsp. salilacus]|uniref:PIN-like domain-containing protein n=1 Tax=Flavobacterium TaxID=237 RepID=UPI001074A708|nr:MULTISPECIES: hypothetical protein [Flavobacterium]KAF2519929.1 hypothetical protein E0W68_01500 [Flavobacterium salilacus subsp. salilacus]MBE1614160.1 hypothetical protein [Flavobacterium sp. SaA2.13]